MGSVVNNVAGIIGDFAGNGDVIITGAESSWNNAHVLIVGRYNNGTLAVESGGTVFNDDIATIGYYSGANGSVEVSGNGSVWTSNDDIYLAREGTADLRVTDGGHVSSRYVYVARETGSSGTALISGADSCWATRHLFYIGEKGVGQLEISNRGMVVSDRSIVGVYAGASGSVVVSGVGTLWDTSLSTVIGSFGEGELLIEQGASIHNGEYGFIGNNTGGVGTVTVTGTGSHWNCENFVVGRQGQGTLHIESGGTVNVTQNTWVGKEYEGVGAINLDNTVFNTGGLLASPTELLGTGVINTNTIVSDLDLRFNTSLSTQQQIRLADVPDQDVLINLNVSDPSNTSAMGAGYRDHGSVVIEDGVSVRSGSGLLGYHRGSYGDAQIDGAGSSWYVDGELLVGYMGDGEVSIYNGGYLSSLQSDIGSEATANGTVIVSGAGSVWDNSGTVMVGRYGRGRLDIIDGGVVNSGSLTLNKGVSTTYPVQISGAGSELNLDASLSVASGILNIRDGGCVVSLDGNVVGNAPSSRVSVEGAGASWHSLGDITIGGSGYGTLHVGQRGTVSIGGNLIIEGGSSGYGTINLEGGEVQLLGGDIIASRGELHLNFTGGRLSGVKTITIGDPFSQQGGVLAPGNGIGTTNLVGHYVLNSGTIEIELGGNNNAFDKFKVSASAEIAPIDTTLELLGIGSIKAGTYSIIETQYGNVIGEFADITGLAMYTGLVDVTYTSKAVMVTLNWDYVPGDLNADGFVGLDDLDTRLLNWNQNVGMADLSSGDISGDGYIGLDDLDVLLNNWNAGTPPTNASALIPEPAVGCWMGLALIMLNTSRSARLSRPRG